MSIHELRHDLTSVLAEKCCFGGPFPSMFKGSPQEDIQNIYRAAKEDTFEALAVCEDPLTGKPLNRNILALFLKGKRTQ